MIFTQDPNNMVLFQNFLAYGFPLKTCIWEDLFRSGDPLNSFRLCRTTLDPQDENDKFFDAMEGGIGENTSCGKLAEFSQAEFIW